MGTKNAERLRRKKNAIGREIKLSEKMLVPVRSSEFFLNDKNKNQLITVLIQKLESVGFRTKQAVEDADVLIVRTALENARYEKVVLVGNDTDLLVILAQLAGKDVDIAFNKVGTGKNPCVFYSSNSFKLFELRSIVAFLYVFTGCDTVSAFHRIGKSKILNCLPKEKLLELATPFNEAAADPSVIIANGIQVIKALYLTDPDKAWESKYKKNLSLSELRFRHYQNATMKKSSQFQLQNLPPTETAAAQHCLRAYHQVQTWLGNYLDPLKYGWKLENSCFLPTTSTDEMIPPEVANIVSCRCQSGCGNQCGCRKHGLQCSKLCGFCNGDNCTNSPTIEIEEGTQDNSDILNRILENTESSENDTNIIDNDESSENCPANVAPPKKKKKTTK